MNRVIGWLLIPGLTLALLFGSEVFALELACIDPSFPNTPPSNTAAFRFATTLGPVTILRPEGSGGWLDQTSALRAPEEFDVLWYHDAEGSAGPLGTRACDDLRAYVELGGVLLLSGAAGRFLNDAGIEPTSLRILPRSTAPFISGLVVEQAHLDHPLFQALDLASPCLLTSSGCNALSDFYATEGPTGELLSEGNALLGERPVVEYKVGAGTILFVGWRLADFDYPADPFRPNLERFYGNALHYLASKNVNHARLIRPSGDYTYERILGLPFLKAATPQALTAMPDEMRSAAVLSLEAGLAPDYTWGEYHVGQRALDSAPLSLTALGLTLCSGEKVVSLAVERFLAEEEEFRQHDLKLEQGLKILTPTVSFQAGPLRPLVEVYPEQAVLLGRSPFMAPGEGLGAITPVYEPLEEGGFTITNSTRQLNRPIVQGQNRVWTGDVPLFRMDTTTGNGCYSSERVYPLWPRPDAAAGGVYPAMGTLRIGVPGEEGQPVWLDTLPGWRTSFYPGYTAYELVVDASQKIRLTVTPALEGHGLLCRLDFTKPTPILWQYGGIWWSLAEANANQVEVAGRRALISEANLPNNLVVAGCDSEGELTPAQAGYGQRADFVGTEPRKQHSIVATWGVTQYDQSLAAEVLKRLDTPNSSAWPEERDRLKMLWFDCYLGKALDPQSHFDELMAAPEKALRQSCAEWDDRRDEFRIDTPDKHLDALINWSRATTEYHRQGPGLILGAQFWVMYSHISTGWYGKEWGGDHQALEDCLRLYGAMQADDGFIRWVSPSLVAFNAENNTPYWVDQVWRHYTWTDDEQFVIDMWPAVKKAVAWHCEHNDPDGDGLFRDSYEYWNCDSNGKGPKAAAPSAMGWAMLDRAAKLASVVGDEQAELEYRGLAGQSRRAVMAQLWREDRGRLGSIGADGLWRGHPQTWEEYLAINAGLLSPEQGRSAMRWLESHYGFEPNPGVKLLPNSDWWPIRWSCQWVPTGDTCLAALAGMKSGDVDLWYPYLSTAVGSSYQSDFPGINMGISNFGAGGGDREDVDSVDPFCHAVVRGLFGIEPRLDEGWIGLCPAFPTGWKQASIKQPDISYKFNLDGDTATFVISTPKPLVKKVRANLTGPEVVTPAEKLSVVKVKLGPIVPSPESPTTPPILAEQEKANRDLELITPGESVRQRLFDLSGAYNLTWEELYGLSFTFDYADAPGPWATWWGNPAWIPQPSPRMVEASNGLRFLTAGLPRRAVAKPKSLLALSSWPPYPLPAAATLPIGLRSKQLWLLLQCYVHPMKNYIPNGEVVLKYATGEDQVVSLIPPYNLDVYFQPFSQQGVMVQVRQRSSQAGFGFVHAGLSTFHANALPIECDPSRELVAVELRATCSEGILGLAGMTVIEAE